MMRQLPDVQVAQEYVEFGGGLDTVTTPLKVKSGFAREAQNFECDINGGYRRIDGYERFDGRPSPSDAEYHVLTISLTGALAVGDVLTDNATTSYGTVIALPSGQAILTKLTGNFSTGNIKVSGVTVGTCTGAQVVSGASTPLLNAQYRNLAADEYRDDIAAVTGSGDILGVWMLNDVVYAWRNNAGGTAAAIYKSTASGWSAVALGRKLAFTSGGTYEILEGDTITGATGGATAVITRVVLTSGTWAAGTAAGTLIFASDTGAFQAENLNVGANLNVATIAGDASAITLSPSGSYEFVTANFGGSSTTKRIYGCDGVNTAFEFDGAVWAPIVTGMTTDTPTHICVHKNHLFLSFYNSVQHSAPGDPYSWSVVVGAAELAMGDPVTGFKGQAGSQGEGALLISSEDQLAVLYGTSSSDWELIFYKSEAGAYAGSIQHLGTTIMLDDRGLTSLARSQEYGNFADASISNLIQDWLAAQRSAATVTGSCVMRDKNQYRLFFSNKKSLFVTINAGQVSGMLPQLYSHSIKNVCSLEMNDGTEMALFGSTDGYVFQMDKGTSFDGGAIESYLSLAYNHSQGPRVLKRYRRASFEVQGDGYATFSFSYEIGYTTAAIDQPVSETVVTSFSAAYWDDAATVFDSFQWDGSTLLPTTVDLSGTAENISLKVRSNADYFYPFTLSGAILEYTPRRRMR